ncbi:LysR family transcriptional regulator [Ruixingdingia sedimenti]|uniref:LysR family transcriptional regulator n=1 Tax=Ruixingdingia sedimenti TaxID=3073604 RepID=A0ABU1F4M6_9RHOB|nr:LysR family transcriptional regulator [Xinfangfangia sp. LG-4]MDR5651764.1 LysR family transcriptional regulator [Xinfangfangia sp. LG-4]
MELRQLHYFVAVYEEGSITQAAHRLNIVQPAVSQQLAKLEGELGGTLFQRTSKGLKPTYLGENAYRLFRPLVQGLEAARHDLSSDRHHVGGMLSIGAIASIAHDILPDTLIAMGARHPDVTFRVTGGYSAEMLELLRVGRIDVAIINQGPRPRPDLIEEELFHEGLALVCAPDHPAVRRGGPVVQADLDQLALPTFRHGLRDVIDLAAREAGLRLDPKLECDEIAMLEQFVTRGGHVTILPAVAVLRGLSAGRLAILPLAPNTRRRVVFAHSATRPMSRAAQVFLSGLRDRLRRVPRDLITLSS